MSRGSSTTHRTVSSRWESLQTEHSVAVFGHIEATLTQRGAFLDRHDGIGQPMGVLGRHLQEVKGNALRRLRTNARQSTQLINQGSERSGEQLVRHFAGARKRLEKSGFGGRRLIRLTRPRPFRSVDVDLFNPVVVFDGGCPGAGVSATTGGATSAAPVRPSSTMSCSVTGAPKCCVRADSTTEASSAQRSRCAALGRANCAPDCSTVTNRPPA